MPVERKKVSYIAKAYGAEPSTQGHENSVDGSPLSIEPTQPAVHDGLQDGDIVVFRNRPTPDDLLQTKIGFKIIMAIQTLLSYKHGHYDSGHVGVVSVSPFGELKMNHVTVAGYQQEDFNPNNVAFIFRANDPAVRENIAKNANLSANQVSLTYSFFAMVKNFVRNSILKPTYKERDKVSDNTYCSKFVADVIELATKNNDNEKLSRNAANSPSALEAALYNNENYSLHLYTAGKTPVDEIKKVIEGEIGKYGDKNEIDVTPITSQLHREYTQIKSDRSLDEIQKAARCYVKFEEIMKKEMGHGIREIMLKDGILTQVRIAGILPRDIKAQKEALNETAAPDDHSIRPKQR